MEPIKVLIIFEYKDKKAFDKCQTVFLKFMPKISDLILNSNIRGKNIR